MTYNHEMIAGMELDLDARAMCAIYRQDRYLYRKILKLMPEKIDYYPIETMKGLVVSMGFISNSDLAVARIDRRFKEPKEKRTVMGRPFLFCKGCPVKNKCSLDVRCEEREEYLRKKKARLDGSFDERYYKNGKPKKYLVLCKYSRYKGGYRKGVCQKESCRFYSEGNCELFLYKE